MVCQCWLCPDQARAGVSKKADPKPPPEKFQLVELGKGTQARPGSRTTGSETGTLGISAQEAATPHIK